MRRQQAGFTLTEVLVAVGICAVLAAMILPAISNSIMAAKRTSCAANMRQIGTALLTYANDHDGDFPETSHTTTVSKAWISVLSPYLSDMDKVRICPADPKGAARLEAGGTSYILNSFVFVPQLDPFGRPMGVQANNIRRIPKPSHTITVFVVSDDRGVGVTNDHTHSENWDRGWNRLLYDIEPDRHRLGDRSEDRTGGSANYLYADGHVETLTAKHVHEQCTQGINIARPPE